MRILGIDPGTRITGYGVLEGQDLNWTCIDYGTIRPPEKDRLSLRYRCIYQGLLSLIERFHPDAISVETQYVAANPQSALKLGMARGMVLLAAAQHEIALFEYTPCRAKQAVTGSGRASKSQVQAMMGQLLGLKHLPEPEDAADALALALCHAHAHTRLPGLGVLL